MRLEPVAAGEALVLQELVVEREAPDEHPDVGAGQCVGGDSAVFQRLPGGLQQQALLRVQGVRLTRRDSEELGVELVDLAEETASAGDDLARLGRAGIVIAGSVPSRFGDGPGGVGLAAEQIPEALRGLAPTRKAASDTDDRQRLTAAVLSAHVHPLPSPTTRLDEAAVKSPAAPVRRSRSSRR